MEIVVLTNGKAYQTYKVFEDGSATINIGYGNIKIADFANFFIVMCMMGWRNVSETYILS